MGIPIERLLKKCSKLGHDPGDAVLYVTVEDLMTYVSQLSEIVGNEQIETSIVKEIIDAAQSDFETIGWQDELEFSIKALLEASFIDVVNQRKKNKSIASKIIEAVKGKKEESVIEKKEEVMPIIPHVDAFEV